MVITIFQREKMNKYNEFLFLFLAIVFFYKRNAKVLKY